jgi:hypothetical protein
VRLCPVNMNIVAQKYGPFKHAQKHKTKKMLSEPTLPILLFFDNQQPTMVYHAAIKFISEVLKVISI